METGVLQSMDVIARNEGRATRAIEKRTARIPSGAYFALAVGSMIASAVLMQRARPALRSRRLRGDLANFVGQWAPAFLIIGLYNKIVKLESELLGD